MSQEMPSQSQATPATALAQILSRFQLGDSGHRKSDPPVSDSYWPPLWAEMARQDQHFRDLVMTRNAQVAATSQHVARMTTFQVDRMLRLTKQLQMVDADTSRINDNTLHLAVSLLYDFTSLQTKLDPELAEIACTKLAESMSEVSNEYYKRERCESFARTPIASQGRWSREDILRAESVVFQRLQARLHRPTAAWFLHSSLAVGECDTQVRNLAQYINTLGLYDPNMQDQPAALRAQVSLLLAVYAASRNSLPSQTSCRECMETSCWNQVRTATCWSNSKETVMPVFTRMCHLLTTERFRLEAQGLTAVVDQRYSAVARSLPTRFPSELANELLLPSLQHCLQ